MNDRDFEVEKAEGKNWGFNILIKYTNRRRFSVSDPRSIGSNVELVRFPWTMFSENHWVRGVRAGMVI